MYDMAKYAKTFELEATIFLWRFGSKS